MISKERVWGLFCELFIQKVTINTVQFLSLLAGLLFYNALSNKDVL